MSHEKNRTDKTAGLSPAKRALLERRLKGTGAAAGATTIPRRSTSEPPPLSFAQQRLWFLDQLQPGTVAYNVPGTFRLAGQLDVPALEWALNEIVRRHEVLRASFPAVDGTARQVIADTLRLDIPTIDASHLDPAAREAQARRLVEEEVQQPFDLATGPVIRARLVKLAPDDHLLLLSLHHIVSDGWSVGVLRRELSALYQARVAGQPSSLADLPIQYGDFALWQRAWLQGAELEQQLGYWRRQLEGVERLQLPTDHPRPAAQTYVGAIEILDLGPELTEAMKALTQKEGVTLFMTLFAGFSALLQRYTGQTDIVVGSPIANRTRSELESLIGFFVNSLALRTRPTPDTPFRTLVREVARTAHEAFAHQDVPFERLVEELQPERDLSRNPVFQVMFALQNAPSVALELPGLRLVPFQGALLTTRFDLELHVLERPGDLRAVLFYNTDLFEAATAQRLLAHYRALLAQAARRPDAAIADLDILEDAERQQIVVGWNDDGAPAPREAGVAELFAEQAAQTPDAIAAVYGGDEITYKQLNAQANRLARYLIRHGVGPDVPVGVLMDRSVDMLTGLLAVLKAGGAYVPLDPTYPADRLLFIVEDAGIQVVVCQQHHRSLLTAAAHVKSVAIDRERKEIGTEPATDPGIRVSPDNVAYVMYTSGSTGRPKGVAVAHRAIVRLVRDTNYIAIRPDDRIVQASNAAFDASTFEIWGALLNGAMIVGVSKDVALTPTEFADVLRRERITTLFLTTALFNQLAQDVPGVYTTLRHVLFGGEAVDPRIVRDVVRHGKPERLLHVYGPTETTTYATWELVTEVREDATTVPIGKPLSNTTLYVLDTRLKPVPAGVPGELFIGGPGLARGYWRHPMLTADRFVPDPCGSVPGARLYRTGDRVRWTRQGSIEFLGRADDQVKIRGFRIEPGEIEATLTAHRAVGDAVVMPREDGGERKLVAYIVPRRDDAAGGGEREGARVGRWRDVYDRVIYEGVPEEADDPTFNIKGWASSYTGRPLGAPAMREQVAQTVDRVLARGPRRVLEIGCGTGLLLFRILPHCERYVGTDFSSVALAHIDRHLDPSLRGRVQLLERGADDFSDLAEGTFDAVVLNSTIQYFPSLDYLLRVIDGAIRVLAPGGTLFLGDVRHLGLHELFHTAVQLFQAAPDVSASRLRQRIAQQVTQEQELLVSPGFFAALQRRVPAIVSVQIQPKRGRHRHELTEFRYDAQLQVGGVAPAAVAVDEWLDAGEPPLTIEAIRARVASASGRVLGFRGLANARMTPHLSAVRALDATRDAGATAADVRTAAAASAEGIDPEDLWALGEELGCVVHITWAAGRTDGSFDAVFDPSADANARRLHSAPSDAEAPLAAQVNQPLEGASLSELVPQLRSYLSERLPEYMVPSAFVVLSAFPLNPNGKVDRKALPAPEGLTVADAAAFVAPRNGLEEEIAGIWQQLLSLDRVSVHDNFFDLGGHSLMATRVISRVREMFQVEVGVRSLFEHPTVAGLAEVLMDRLLEQEGGSAAAAGMSAGGQA